MRESNGLTLCSIQRGGKRKTRRGTRAGKARKGMSYIPLVTLHLQDADSYKLDLTSEVSWALSNRVVID